MEMKPVVAKDYALIDLHLDGSLSLASVRELAAMQQIVLPESDRELWAWLLREIDRRFSNLSERSGQETEPLLWGT